MKKNIESHYCFRSVCFPEFRSISLSLFLRQSHHRRNLHYLIILLQILIRRRPLIRSDHLCPYIISQIRHRHLSLRIFIIIFDNVFTVIAIVISLCLSLRSVNRLAMGNCHTAEATAVVVLLHPGYKVETINRSVTARDVMNSNPGHYVGQLVKSPVKYLKLLRPNDTLLVGQVYRLISYEDVLKEFAAKKCVKLGKLLMERGVIAPVKEAAVAPVPVRNISSGKNVSRRENGGRKVHESHGGGQWKPALKTISEIGN